MTLFQPLAVDGDDSNSVDSPVVAEGKSSRIRFPDDMFIYSLFKK
jgi:hypothetical protein